MQVFHIYKHIGENQEISGLFGWQLTTFFAGNWNYMLLLRKGKELKNIFFPNLDFHILTLVLYSAPRKALQSKADTKECRAVLVAVLNGIRETWLEIFQQKLFVEEHDYQNAFLKLIHIKMIEIAFPII